PRLAVAALRHIFFNPRFLNRVGAVGGETFDRGDLLSLYAGDGRDARARRFAVDVHRTSATQRYAATELRPGHIQRVAQDPQKRHLGIHIDGGGFSIQRKSDGHKSLPRRARYRTPTPRMDGNARNSAGSAPPRIVPLRRVRMEGARTRRS